MTPVLVVLTSLLMAITVSFALSPLIIASLRLLDRARRSPKSKREIEPPLAVAVLNISVEQRAKFSVGPDFALAAALSVIVLSIPMEPVTTSVVCQNV